jgi:hypothetical protein
MTTETGNDCPDTNGMKKMSKKMARAGRPWTPRKTNLDMPAHLLLLSICSRVGQITNAPSPHVGELLHSSAQMSSGSAYLTPIQPLLSHPVPIWISLTI